MVAYVSGPMRRLAGERAKGVRDQRGGRGKCVENRKKILNSGNEPKNVLQTQELAFSGAKNELVFRANELKLKPKKWPKTHLLCVIDRLRKNSLGVSFRGVPQARDDEESRIVLKTLRARFLAEFILRGQGEILLPRLRDQNDSLEGFFRSLIEPKKGRANER